MSNTIKMTRMSTPLVWLITGTSTGLGRLLAEEALARGDQVIATARERSVSQLDDLKIKGAHTLELDVTDSLENIKAFAEKAVSVYGRVDVLVNNAGWVLPGAIEENTPEEIMGQYQTHVLGGLNVATAFLPYMRERKSGTIVWIGSIAGWGASPYAGIYGSTKAAIRSISTTLHEEISPLGLRSICFDFGYFRTALLTQDHRAPRTGRIGDYAEITEYWERLLDAVNGKQPGDPRKGAKVMIDVIRGEGLAADKPFPTYLMLGSDAYAVAKNHFEKDSAMVEAWKEVTCSTDF